jgi:hypothetical protein
VPSQRGTPAYIIELDADRLEGLNELVVLTWALGNVVVGVLHGKDDGVVFAETARPANPFGEALAELVQC